jgi:hypothetical protein
VPFIPGERCGRTNGVVILDRAGDPPLVVDSLGFSNERIPQHELGCVGIVLLNRHGRIEWRRHIQAHARDTMHTAPDYAAGIAAIRRVGRTAKPARDYYLPGMQAYFRMH